MRTGVLFMGLEACSASQDASQCRSGGFPIEAESDIETTEVGDTADSCVPHVSEARRRGQGVSEGERGTQASARLAAGPQRCRPTRERRMGQREAEWGAGHGLGH